MPLHLVQSFDLKDYLEETYFSLFRLSAIDFCSGVYIELQIFIIINLF